MNYLRSIDYGRLGSTAERVSLPLFGPDTGAINCSVNCIKTPPGEGSPAGLHTHAVDQLFFILGGTMTVVIAGEEHEAGPGTLVIFPSGIPHRNWNRSSEATIHLAINCPLPDPTVPFAQPVG